MSAAARSESLNCVLRSLILYLSFPGYDGYECPHPESCDDRRNASTFCAKAPLLRGTVAPAGEATKECHDGMRGKENNEGADDNVIIAVGASASAGTGELVLPLSKSGSDPISVYSFLPNPKHPKP